MVMRPTCPTRIAKKVPLAVRQQRPKLAHFPRALNAPKIRSVINTLGACLLLVDASCMAMLADNVLRWEGTSRAKQLDTAVTIIQLVALVGEFFLFCCSGDLLVEAW